MSNVQLTDLGLPTSTRACLFDLDGVLTQTATLHAKAWKQTFDEVLRSDADTHHTEFRPFDIGADYLQYVDGKPREDGVRDFLAARNIHPPEGERSDPPSAATVWGIGNRKNELVQQLIETEGVDVFDDARTYLEAVTQAGLKRIVVSSSANTAKVLQVTGLDAMVDGRIDGVTLAERHLPGKPAPDGFLAGADLAGAAPGECVAFEDALSGVQAGHAAGCYTIGVDRLHDGHHGADLRAHGADHVVTALTELLTDEGDRR